MATSKQIIPISNCHVYFFLTLLQNLSLLAKSNQAVGQNILCFVIFYSLQLKNGAEEDPLTKILLTLLVNQIKR